VHALVRNIEKPQLAVTEITQLSENEVMIGTEADRRQSELLSPYITPSPKAFQAVVI